MIVCLDIGNSLAKAGLFDHGRLIGRFDRETASLGTSAEWISWLDSCLRQLDLAPGQTDAVRCCSVVPDLQPALESCCRELFGREPFILQAASQQFLALDYRDPTQLGSDRLAAAIGACRRWPNEHLIVVGCGTALTFCCIDKNRRHLGGAITAGPGLIARSLHAGTGRLPPVAFQANPPVLGRCTQAGIQSGLFFGLLGQIRELSERLRAECFAGQRVRRIGTGGYTTVLQALDVFDDVEPDLALQGLSTLKT